MTIIYMDDYRNRVNKPLKHKVVITSDYNKRMLENIGISLRSDLGEHLSAFMCPDGRIELVISSPRQ